MKATVFAWIVLVGMNIGQASEAPAVKLTIEMRTGEKMAVTKISKVEPDGLTVWTESGVTKIPVSKLAKTELEKFNLSEESATAHTAAREKQEAAYAQREAAPNLSAVVQAKEPRFISLDQVKTMWRQGLTEPRRLDPNYHHIMASYRDIIAEINDGAHDNEAGETAATINKAIAIKAGNYELAKIYELEMARFSQAKSADAALASQQKRDKRDRTEYLMLQSKLMSINSKLRNIDTTIRSW